MVLAGISQGRFGRVLRPGTVLPMQVGGRMVSPSVISAMLTFYFVCVSVVIVNALLVVTVNIKTRRSVNYIVSDVNGVKPKLNRAKPTCS